MTISIEDLKKSVGMAVELEDGSMEYLGEFDMTDWNKGWDQAWAKASDISEELGFDPDMMNLNLMDNWLEIAHRVHHLQNQLNKKDDSGWFVIETCMERNDALLVKEMLDKHKDSFFLEELLKNYEKWDKL